MVEWITIISEEEDSEWAEEWEVDSPWTTCLVVEEDLVAEEGSEEEEGEGEGTAVTDFRFSLVSKFSHSFNFTQYYTSLLSRTCALSKSTLESIVLYL